MKKIDQKFCKTCNQNKPLTEYYPRVGRSGNLYTYSECKTCHDIRSIDNSHRSGRNRPMYEAKDCTNYLGIVVAERVLSHYFEDVQRMPNGNPGYDFICKKGFKIDSKCACRGKRGGVWQFGIRRNKVADYFMCLAFDNRESLEPLHIWLIPGEKVNHLSGIEIADTKRILAKWAEYEKPLDKVIACCSTLRGRV